MLTVLLDRVFGLRVRWINVWRTFALPLAILVDAFLVIITPNSNTFWGELRIAGTIILMVMIVLFSVVFIVAGYPALEAVGRVFNPRWLRSLQRWFMETYFERVRKSG